jgi:putative FmdB family regulatory protein
MEHRMPIYDYECASCGPFRRMMKMSEAGAACACPACGEPGRKQVTAPYLADMKPQTRMAHARNEKSAHEPKVVRRGEAGGDWPGGHGHHHHAHGDTHADGWIQSRHRSMIGH